MHHRPASTFTSTVSFRPAGPTSAFLGWPTAIVLPSTDRRTAPRPSDR